MTIQGKNSRFVVIEYPLMEGINGKKYLQECIGIGMKISNLSDVVFPSPLTKFIKDRYRRKNSSTSAQRNAASEITKFLNYCRTEALDNNTDFEELKFNGVKGLNRIHGSRYISDLSLRNRAGELSGKYVNSIIRYLNNFYSWLKEQDLLLEDFNVYYMDRNVRYKNNRDNKKLVQVDLFDNIELGTIYPSNKNKITNKLVDFGKKRYEIVRNFLDIAEQRYPDVYLGACLQFFGGLRKGEVVNLTKKSIVYTEEGFELIIDDNREILFPNKKDTRHEQVKVKRFQGLLMNKRLESALLQHLQRMEKLQRDGKLINNECLFFSSHNGQPLSGKAYWEQFNKVKKELIEYLRISDQTKSLLFLTKYPWSTHIARGVFTNFCFDIGMSLSEVAIARGDSDLNSVLKYIEKLSTYEKMTDAMNNIRLAYDDQLDKKLANNLTKYSKVWTDINEF